MLVIAGLAIAEIGCAARSTTSTPTYSVTIGVDLPQAGRDAGKGLMALHGVQLAVSDADEQPDQTIRFDLDLHDTARGGFQDPHVDEATDPVFDAAHGAQDVKAFAADSSVLGILGPLESNVALAEVPVAARARLALVSASARDDALTAERGTSTFFRVCAPDHADAIGAAQAVAQLGFVRAFAIDDGAAREQRERDVFTKAAATLPIDVVDGQSYPSNFASLLARIRASRADAVVFFGPAPTNVLIMRVGLAAAVLTPKRERLMGEAGFMPPAFSDADAGRSAVDYYTLWPDQAPRSPHVTALEAAFRRRFGAVPGDTAVQYYAAAGILLDAIKNVSAKCGCLPTRSQVVRALRAYANDSTVIGRVEFAPSGDLTAWHLTLVTIRGSRYLVDTDFIVRAPRGPI